MVDTRRDSTSCTIEARRTLLDILAQRAADTPERSAYAFLSDGDSETARCSYADLWRAVRAWACEIDARTPPNARVILLLPTGLDFVAAFLGSLEAGRVAVPAYPPPPYRASRIRAIAVDARPALVLAPRKPLDLMRRSLADSGALADCDWMAAEDLDLTRADVWSGSPLDPARTAFLQYTSGSTSAPRGVCVTHANLMHNEECIRLAFGLSGDTTVVSWLPLFHDMGLVGALLQPLYVGALSVLLPAAAFLQKPVRWLRAIARYRAHTSGGPNFAYDLCTRKVTPEEAAGLDLSSWRVAFDGAEPVRAETLEAFAARFAPHGFLPDAFMPCYGMAEATLMVATRHAVAVRRVAAAALEHGRCEEPRDGDAARPLVSCGPPCDARLRVVDPDSLCAAGPGEIGEIWLAGPSVADGYWNQPEATAATFDARLADSGDGPFLRTGDLGIVQDGELYITGRKKDLIILRGVNHYPQDIESTVQSSHPALRIGGAAAFSADFDQDGEERLVVVQEVEREALRHLNVEEIGRAAREAVVREHGLELAVLALVKPGGVPKTSSGKLRRSECRSAFLGRTLALLDESRPPGSPGGHVAIVPDAPTSRAQSTRAGISLLYFSANEAEFGEDKYRLFLESARFADRHGFEAVWTPERHFHSFGGLYPNPAVLSAALATITERVRLRAGSVVLPLHHPVRVVEEWAVVDNLSGGRVDLAFARGWNANDFVFAPDNFASSREILFRHVETVRRLWRGEAITLTNGEGRPVDVRVHPLPRQKDLQFWITCSGGSERFAEAGAVGANVLTALLFQSIEELAAKIASYRRARAEHGHDPESGRVTLMLHTFIGRDGDAVRRAVREPFIEYLRTSVDLWRHGSKALEDLPEKERRQLLEYAFERYFQTSALFGTPATCLDRVEELLACGVDEIACLIDFGVPVEVALSGLNQLDELRRRVNSERFVPRSKERLGAVPDADGPSVVQCAPEQLRASERELLRWLHGVARQRIAAILALSPRQVALDQSFSQLGIDSLKGIEIIGRLSEDLGVELSPTVIFEFPTLAKLSEHFVRAHAPALHARRQESRAAVSAPE